MVFQKVEIHSHVKQHSHTFYKNVNYDADLTIIIESFYFTIIIIFIIFFRNN